ncbi:methyl-accepting chemotaxis protein [Oxalobacteraceae bacterium A2-2]
MHWTIKNRLLLSNVITLVFVSLVGLVGFFAVRTLDKAMDGISANSAAIKDQLQADQAHDALRADVLAARLASLTGDTAAQKEVLQDTEEHIALFRKLISEMEQVDTDAEVKQATARVKPDMEAYLQRAGEMVRLSFSDKDAAAAKFGPFMDSFRVLEKSMANLSELIEKNSERAKLVGDEAVVQSRYRIIGGVLLALVVAVLFGRAVQRAIMGPLEQTVAFAARVAQGDLSGQLDISDSDRSETGDLKRALRDMNASLNAIVGTVRSGTDTISTASGEIASGNMDLSARTESQASSLEETAASMEEMTSAVRQNSGHAKEASALAASASGVASKGGAVMEQMVQTMDAIHQSSSRIVDIIAVIEGIAFQTNILALNAAVEAARAGEQGRGFAVVASEVRGLAQRSDSAAKEVRELISASVAQVGEGSRLVHEAGDTMGEVVSAIARVNAIVAEIDSASREQELGIEQVNQAIGAIDGATQQNAALVEQAAAAAASLQEQAERLSEAVRVFRLRG